MQRVCHMTRVRSRGFLFLMTMTDPTYLGATKCNSCCSSPRHRGESCATNDMAEMRLCEGSQGAATVRWWPLWPHCEHHRRYRQFKGSRGVGPRWEFGWECHRKASWESCLPAQRVAEVSCHVISRLPSHYTSDTYRRRDPSMNTMYALDWRQWWRASHTLQVECRGDPAW